MLPCGDNLEGAAEAGAPDGAIGGLGELHDVAVGQQGVFGGVELPTACGDVVKEEADAVDADP